MTILEEKGVTLKAEKCKFGVESVEYLGHKLSVHGVELKENLVKATVEAPILRGQGAVAIFYGSYGILCTIHSQVC